LTTPAVYVSINSTPVELGVLAQAALGNGEKVALLPEGEASTERVTEINIEVSGRNKRLSLYAIRGLDFSPTYLWLDQRQSFFAVVDDWFTVIPEGWEPSKDFIGCSG